MIRDGVGSNELFPSADWRYLLPDPAPATVLADGDGPLATMARRLGPAPPDPVDRAGVGRVDLVVADRADLATIRRLHRTARPGGAAYVEVTWPKHRPASELARRLAEAGFSDGVLYSLSPSRDRWSASWWVPVGHLDGLRLIAGTARPGRRGKRSVVDRLRSGATRAILAVPAVARRHPWLLWPTRPQVLCAVAVKPSSPVAGGSTAQPGLLPKPSPPLVMRGGAIMRVGGSSTDQAMLFGFGDGPQPDVVIKAPTRPEELAATGHEAEMLALLTDRPDPMPGVPQLVPLPGVTGVAAWAQTFLPGRALASVADPVNLDRHGRAMTQWLIELADRTGRSGGDDRVAARAIVELGSLWPLLPDGAALRTRAEAGLRGFTGSGTVCQHRDLGPWNTLIDGDALRVIDWADAEPRGSALCDLHHFLVHLVLCAHDAYDPSRRRDMIPQLFDPSSEVGGLVDHCLGRYGSALGLGTAEVRALRVLTWLLDLLRRPSSERVDSLYLDLLRAELCWLEAPSTP